MVCAPVSLCAQELKAQSEKAETQKNQQDAQKSSMENDVQSVAISVNNSNVHIATVCLHLCIHAHEMHFLHLQLTAMEVQVGA